MSKTKKTNSRRVFDVEVGLRIALAREMRKMRQEDLGKYLSITRTSVINIEYGRQSISFQQANIIAKALRIPLARLVPKFALDGMK